MAKLSRVLGGLLFVGLGTATAAADSNPFTPIHEAGRCAIRGHCGSKGFFGKPLPCPDNGLAEEPDVELRDELVKLCGAKWSSGPVCCDLEQVCDVERKTYASTLCLTLASPTLLGEKVLSHIDRVSR